MKLLNKTPILIDRNSKKLEFIKRIYRYDVYDPITNKCLESFFNKTDLKRYLLKNSYYINRYIIKLVTSRSWYSIKTDAYPWDLFEFRK